MGRLFNFLALRMIQMMLEIVVASLCLVFLNVSAFENMAEEFVEMFKREIMLKRLITTQLSSLSSEVPQPVNNINLGISSISHTNKPSSEILQIYLTTWLAEVNIETHRADEILALVGEEMRVPL